MKSIEEIALEVAKDTPKDMHEEDWVVWFATKFIEAWLAQQEPVAWMNDDGEMISEYYRKMANGLPYDDMYPLFRAPATAIPEGWQSIETAPTDGTYVLLFEKYEEHPFVGCYAKGLWKADHSHVDACGGWDGASVVDNICQELVSYWQPLPPPPGEKK